MEFWVQCDADALLCEKRPDKYQINNILSSPQGKPSTTRNNLYFLVAEKEILNRGYLMLLQEVARALKPAVYLYLSIKSNAATTTEHPHKIHGSSN